MEKIFLVFAPRGGEGGWDAWWEVVGDAWWEVVGDAW